MKYDEEGGDTGGGSGEGETPPADPGAGGETGGGESTT